MKKYFIRVRPDYGKGRQYDSNPQELNEEEYGNLKKLIENINMLIIFSMEGAHGEYIFFPKNVMETSVFEIHSVGG